MIMISAFEVTSSYISFYCIICSDSGSTSRCLIVLAFSSDGPNFTITVYSHMSGIQQQNMSIRWHMVAVRTPTCSSCEWETSQASKWKDFSPSISHKRCNIFFWIIMINLIWTRTISIESIIIRESFCFQK